jgi:DNA-binding XRE family transcriptional regulator
MPRLSTGKLAQRQALNELIVYSGRAQKSAGQTPASLLRALRGLLKMSQADLAERAGLTQPHIARLESGAVDAQWGTWTRLFDAMFCDLLLVPRPRTRPGDALAERRLARPRGNPWREIER